MNHMQPQDAHILVVEDDPNNLIVVTEFLDILGVKEVQTSDTGAQGLRMAESMLQLDLILLDIQLPEEDGYTVLRHIRANQKLQGVRVVAVTANVLPQDEARARAAGFDGFIGKPLEFDRFLLQIETLLQGEEVWRPR
jgi:two-component system, cell cycle response regulator DivK